MKGRQQYGLRNVQTDEISKIMNATRKQAQMQKPKGGFVWVVIPEDFKSMTELFSNKGQRRSKPVI